MCGIAGFIDIQRSYDDAEQLIDSMCKVIRHRGPDDQGTWVGEGVALGMRRLSIIDLAGGHQPILNEDHSILIVFNGEIYNYRKLQQELQERGHQFTTNSDTETIVHAYEEYGDDCVKHLRGMFTSALVKSLSITTGMDKDYSSALKSNPFLKRVFHAKSMLSLSMSI